MKQSDKKDRFKRLATKRTAEILKKLRILGNCANRSAYDYSEEEIAKIFSAIERAAKDARSKFYFSRQGDNFKL